MYDNLFKGINYNKINRSCYLALLDLERRVRSTSL